MFVGLEKQLIQSEMCYRNVFPPVSNVVNVAYCSSLEGIERGASSSTLGMACGRFYESISAALFGGYLNDTKFKVTLETWAGSSKPDVIDRERLFFESVNLLLPQILAIL